MHNQREELVANGARKVLLNLANLTQVDSPGLILKARYSV
jgi:hypothetical protein